MEQLGKGKMGFKGAGKGPGGKGKSQIVCWNCGMTGHRAVDCKKPPRFPKGGGKGTKGKGKKGGFNGTKGKGKGLNEVSPEATDVNAVGEFQGYCYNCGDWGHSAKYCPKGKGKGGGGGVN